MYLSIKYFHILSMVLLFGTGFGSAFYKWMSDRTGNIEHIYHTNRQVVLADWIFTTPTVIFQPLSGVLLVYLLDIPITTDWVITSILLFLFAGICWLPVVWLQIKMRALSLVALETNTPLPDLYWRYARIWFWLGIPAFSTMLVIVFLMVHK
ncbi:MAG: DUF2269 domain-containing protein [Gammaproteobacteria bacterium]|nr:DUF2269 domain-containing protein [Gammaproteobacteria bacterium]